MQSQRSRPGRRRLRLRPIRLNVVDGRAEYGSFRMSSDTRSADSSLPTYTSGLKRCPVALAIGLVMFLLGAALIWLPVVACNWERNPSECFAPGAAFLLLEWLVSCLRGSALNPHDAIKFESHAAYFRDRTLVLGCTLLATWLVNPLEWSVTASAVCAGARGGGAICSATLWRVECTFRPNS